METSRPEGAELGPEKKEKKLYKFVYRDYSKSGGRKIIFECVAESILDADQWYELETGKNPEKQNHVGCSVKEIEDSQT